MNPIWDPIWDPNGTPYEPLYEPLFVNGTEVHPAARILVDISKAQDNEVGDGTTSVVVITGAQPWPNHQSRSQIKADSGLSMVI